ncbi:MAG: histidine phosphatase family protein [Candidatus Pacebacteria bacterium]|nr:histidine phosphatase family protein [Candidatus Paceibacterota bacterium]
MMPINVLLVRHGQSEQNVANDHSRKGDHSLFTTELRNKHSSKWRLSAKGIQEAQQTGKWIKDNIQFPIDRCYSSEYDRARETAGYLDIPNAQWYLEMYLRERDWGDLECVPHNEQTELFSEELRKQQEQPFFWIPPNGVSLADVCLRVDRVLDTLHRECSDKNVIIVCHGEIMWAIRTRLERIDQGHYQKLHNSKNPFDRIHNGQVLHYTRRDPFEGTLNTSLSHMRSICPGDESLSSNNWQTIQRDTFSNQDLLDSLS